ncbi:MAG: metallophosphoesterase [Rikenellaceae bacterium]|jgi:predicted MPP superfamily phosphohydrolase|nr:metallophosphoesterase [Rikenellaceae bacterium]
MHHITFRILLILLAFNVVAETYFYRTALCKWTKNRALRVLYWVVDAIFIAFWFFMILGRVDERNLLPESFFQNSTLVYLLIYIPKFIYMLFSFPAFFFRMKDRYGRPRSEGRKGWRRLFFALGGVAAIYVFYVIGYGGTLGLQKLRTTHFSIASEEIPPAFDGYRIVHLSDFHLGNMRTMRVMDKLLDSLQTIRPDVILFTGDLVHAHTGETARFETLLQRFAGMAPCYAVLGNHDYGGYARWKTDAEKEVNLQELVDFYDHVGWHLLNNRSATLHRGADSVALIGIENWGHPPYPRRGDLLAASVGISDGAYRILLSHDPTFWLERVAGHRGIDLTLSGHTHAMQMVFSVFGKRISPASAICRAWGGLYEQNGQRLIVNEGIGVALFPYRYGATPEITLITLKREP